MSLINLAHGKQSINICEGEPGRGSFLSLSLSYPLHLASSSAWGYTPQTTIYTYSEWRHRGCLKPHYTSELKTATNWAFYDLWSEGAGLIWKKKWIWEHPQTSSGHLWGLFSWHHRTGWKGEWASDKCKRNSLFSLKWQLADQCLTCRSVTPNSLWI